LLHPADFFTALLVAAVLMTQCALASEWPCWWRKILPPAKKNMLLMLSECKDTSKHYSKKKLVVDWEQTARSELDFPGRHFRRKP
jgi:hypothetical protein